MRFQRTRKSAGVLATALTATGLGGCAASVGVMSQPRSNISPDGAAYSYVIPDGFFIAGGHPQSTDGRVHASAVVTGTGDAVIRVSDQSLAGVPADTPAHTASVEEAFTAQAKRWTHPPVEWRHETMAGAPALRYHLTSGPSDRTPQEAEEVAIFRDLHIVYVSCNWRSDASRTAALRGCEQVLDSLRIIGT